MIRVKASPASAHVDAMIGSVVPHGILVFAAATRLRRRLGWGLRWLVVAALPGMLAGPVCASECYSIKEPDRKNYCLAVTTDKPSYCYAIKSPDAKNACLAEVKHKRSYCYSIKATDLRNQCLAETK